MTTSHSGPVCRACGRRIWAKASVARGYGGRCWWRVRAAARALEASRLPVAVKAAEVLTDGAAYPSRTHPGTVWLVAGSAGYNAYRTARESCSCEAGRRYPVPLGGRGTCAHRVAVAVLAELWPERRRVYRGTLRARSPGRDSLRAA